MGPTLPTSDLERPFSVQPTRFGKVNVCFPVEELETIQQNVTSILGNVVNTVKCISLNILSFLTVGNVHPRKKRIGEPLYLSSPISSSTALSAIMGCPMPVGIGQVNGGMR